MNITNIKNKLRPLQKMYEKIWNNMKNDHINAFAAQCAYYVILSFIPFLILLLTLIQYTNVQPQQLFSIVSKVIPENMSEMVLGVIMEVYSKSLGTISISLIFTLFSADRGLYALIKGLRSVYNFSDDEGKSFIYLKLMSLLKTIAFIVIMVVGLVVLVFGSSIISTIQDHFGLLRNYTIIYKILTYIIAVFVIFIAFLCIYKFVPGHKTTFKSQIRGAAFGSIALNIVSFLFSRYLDIFKGFSTTYGSLTTLMLIMMWTYTCFYVIFLGAEINKFYDMRKMEKIL